MFSGGRRKEEGERRKEEGERRKEEGERRKREAELPPFLFSPLPFLPPPYSAIYGVHQPTRGWSVPP